MTREHRLVLSLDEIQAVRWTCPQCKAAITFRLEETIRLPDQCPACNDPLMGAVEEATKTAREFLRTLKAATRSPSLLSLEFTDEDVPRK
jgi:hypothetical protein